MTEMDEREAAAAGLLRSADAHDRGDFAVVEREFDTFEGSLSQDASGVHDDVLLAFSFWDGWVDSSNHGWQYYEPLKQSDWPVLARTIAAALRSGDPVSDPEIVASFSIQPRRESWLSRAWKRLTTSAN
jgi:hypothetical protein